MERNHHSGPEQGAGQGTGDTGREPGTDRPPQPAPADTGATDAPAGADVIMSRLPRTRPQVATGRRQRHAAATPAPQTAPTAPATTPPAGRRRPAAKAGTGSTTRAAQQAKRVAATRAGSAARAKRSTASRPAPAAARATRETAEPPQETRRAGDSGAASLPRLAVDGAVEAAKLPLKVGGRLTLRALDAVARSLRGS